LSVATPNRAAIYGKMNIRSARLLADVEVVIYMFQSLHFLCGSGAGGHYGGDGGF